MQGIEELPRDALIRVLSLTEGDEERCGSQLQLLEASFRH